jgi:hypothetical protein
MSGPTFYWLVLVTAAVFALVQGTQAVRRWVRGGLPMDVLTRWLRVGAGCGVGAWAAAELLW